MRWLRYLYLAAGLALLGVVLAGVDLAEVAAGVARVGFVGVVVVLAIYMVAFVIDCLSWQMTLSPVPMTARWLYRLWKVRMVGEVFNTVTPAAGWGGEPVKAVLLKRHHGIGYRAATASLILAKTINMLGLLPFLALGFAFMLASPALPPAYNTAAGIGLVGFLFVLAAFFLVQRLRAGSAAGTWISRWPAAGRRLVGLLGHVRDMDDRLVFFYTRNRRRFAVATGLAFVNWMLGAVEIYVVMIFLGHPMTPTEAWIVEAALQLVRTGAFFIPAGLGAQEGTFLLVYAAMTGSPDMGIAVAVVRRFREVLWLIWGALLGSLFMLAPTSKQDRDRTLME